METNAPTPRRPTLADVAAAANVSAKSVSRVVNGEPHVSPELAARVREAVRELGYRPDRRARQLASGRHTRLVGFVLVDTANPFFAAVARGLDDVAQGSDTLVISGSTDADPNREAALIETLVELRVDGLVVAAAEGNNDLLRREIQMGTEVVLVDRVMPDLDADTIVTDNRSSTRAAVLHLLDLGHRDIAYLGGNPAVWTARERHAGFREAFAERGLAPPHPDLEVLEVGAEAPAAAATRRLLGSAHPAPTAFVAGQDRITMGVVRALHEQGRHHDVAVIGFDEVPAADLVEPSVAVIAQDPYEMGRRAGQCLVERLAGTRTGDPEMLVVPAELRLRQSAHIRPATS